MLGTPRRAKPPNLAFVKCLSLLFNEPKKIASKALRRSMDFAIADKTTIYDSLCG
ncbi:MAG: hypothetical protein ACXQS2_04660 [Methermicoccaceae archaeon]